VVKKVDWFVPVFRILKEEADAGKLVLLEDQAKALDMRTEELSDEEISEASEVI